MHISTHTTNTNTINTIDRNTVPPSTTNKQDIYLYAGVQSSSTPDMRNVMVRQHNAQHTERGIRPSLLIVCICSANLTQGENAFFVHF